MGLEKIVPTAASAVTPPIEVPIVERDGRYEGFGAEVIIFFGRNFAICSSPHNYFLLQLIKMYTANQEKGSSTVMKPSHQLCRDNPSQPKYIYVNRTTGMPNAWTGSETWVEFDIPQEIGVWQNSTVVFDITVTGSCVLPPAPYWISRSEVYLGSGLIETVYSNEHYHEVVGFRSTQDLDQINEAINIDTDYTFTSAASTGRFYLPLDASLLRAMRPYVRGFKSKFKIRLYFPSSVVSSGTGSAALDEVKLIVEESTNQKEIAKAHNAHQTGVVDYGVIFRERQQEALTFSNSTDQKTIYLRSLKNDSAGLLVYVTPQQPTVAQLNTRVAINNLQVQDEMGGKITEVLDASFLKPFVWPDHINSPFPNNSGNDLYLIPFSSAVGEAVRKGCNYGDRPFTSLEKLVVNPVSATVGSRMVTVVSLSYGFITCAQGRHFVTPKSSRK